MLGWGIEVVFGGKMGWAWWGEIALQAGKLARNDGLFCGRHFDASPRARNLISDS